MHFDIIICCLSKCYFISFWACLGWLQVGKVTGWERGLAAFYDCRHFMNQRDSRLDSICLPSGFFFFLSCLCTKCVLLWMGRTCPCGRSVTLIYVLVKPLQAQLSCSCSRHCELLCFVRSSVMAGLICMEPKAIEVYSAVVLDCFHQRRHYSQIL